MSVIRGWTPEDYERMADAILRGDAVRLGASARDVQDAAEMALDRVRLQLQGAVEALARIEGVYTRTMPGPRDALRDQVLEIIAAYRSAAGGGKP